MTGLKALRVVAKVVRAVGALGRRDLLRPLEPTYDDDPDGAEWPGPEPTIGTRILNITLYVVYYLFIAGLIIVFLAFALAIIL